MEILWFLKIFLINRSPKSSENFMLYKKLNMQDTLNTWSVDVLFSQKFIHLHLRADLPSIFAD